VIRRTLAVVLLTVVTVLMWSDAIVEWWQSFLEWLLAANESATQSVLDARPASDLDLHVIVWATVAWAMATGFAAMRWRVMAFVGVWSLVVESLQPVFTDVRARQALDYLGNVLGVGAVALGFVAVGRLRRRRQPSSPLR
jgi:hypothetical protein